MKYERFKLEYEQLKLEIDHNREAPEALQARVQEIEAKFNRESNFESWQKASVKRVVAEYYLSKGRITEARDRLVECISDLNRLDPKIWMSYARLNEIVLERTRDGQAQALLNALKGYLFATTLNLPKSRLIIPRILKLLRRREHQGSEQLRGYATQNAEQMPAWIWIFWAPQLLAMLSSERASHASLEHAVARHLLFKLVKVYPQAAYYPLRAKFTFPRNGASEALRELLMKLKFRDPQVLLDIELIGKELGESVKPRPEEGLCAWMQALGLSAFLQRPDDLEARCRRCLEGIYTALQGSSGGRPATPLLRALAPGFSADFRDEATREPCILKTLLRLKNLKDFLLATINSRDQTLHLEELSPLLAHFNRRGIEIPGQHLVSETEPLPQRIVFIDRFDSLVHRSGLNQRKIVFKGNNSKSYPFTASPAKCYQTFQTEEKVTQLKVLMNMIFQRHKETLRRGVKFYVTSKLIMYLSKLSQDSISFQDF